jgi:calcineurin-like phosphoesterase family protein
MKVYFTSDTHFSHANIIKYCNRPFYKDGDFIGEGDIANRPWINDDIKQKRAEWMNEVLIKNWNSVVNPEDVVYHLGDFGYINSNDYKKLIDELNGNIIVFQGNHDSNNKIKTYLIKGMMYFGSKSVYAQHHPPEDIPNCDFCICGHVHDKWKHKIYRKHPNTPIINLSCDVWDYKPVSTNSLLKYYGLIKKGIVNEHGVKLL